MLSAAQISTLKAHCAAGKSPSAAARLVQCSAPTAGRYFRKWGWAGKRRAKPCLVPVYDGPDWIGVRIR